MTEKAKPRLPILPEDVERGLRFNHMVDDQTRERLANMNATITALAETLATHPGWPKAQFEERRAAALTNEMERSKKDLAPRFTAIPDKYKMEKLPEIDCEARLPLCQARCCSLSFALSIQDLDERIVRWDYGRPYQIAQRADGYCVHNEAGTCHCTIYENRPGVCRGYDCRNDKRIWNDFEARIPAPPMTRPTPKF